MNRSLLIVFVLLQTANGADWPTFQRNHGRNPVTPEKIAFEQLGIAWKIQANSPAPAWFGPAKWDAYAGIRGLHSMRNYDPVYHPIAVGDQVFFGSSSDDCVVCLDAATGKTRWRYQADGPVRVAPTFHEGRIYVGSDDGFAYCLDAKSGKLIWRFSPSRFLLGDDAGREFLNNGRLIPYWPCRSGILIRDGIAYFTASLLPWKPSFLCAVDARTGSPDGKDCFIRQFEKQTMEGPLLVSDQQVIVPQGRVAPNLFRRTDGNPMGALKGGGGSFVLLTPESTILHGPGNKQGWLTSSDAKTRERVATFKRGKSIVIKGTVSYMLTDSQVIASDFAKRKVLWRREMEAGLQVIASADHVLVGGKDFVVALDGKDGRTKWKAEVDGRAFGLAIARQRLYVSTDQGTLYCYQVGAPPAVTSVAKGSRKVSTARRPLAAVKRFQDPGLVHRWVFQRPHATNARIRDWVGGRDIVPEGKLNWEQVGDREFADLGSGTRLVVAEDYRQAKGLPQRDFSVEAWLRIKQPQTWGAAAGIIQDNGSFERGWLLGYRDNRFAWAVCAKDGPNKLTYLTANETFDPEKYYHVVGTYDGEVMRLFVNGRQVAESKEQKGEIHYPPKAFFELGAYHDDNENYPMQGQLHELRIYKRSLSLDEIKQHAAEIAVQTETGVPVQRGPWIRFTDASSAEIRWTTKEPSLTRLTQINGDQSTVIQDGKQLRRDHTIVLRQLRRPQVYHVTISHTLGGKLRKTPPYEVDTFFNYNRPAVAGSAGKAAKSKDPLGALPGLDTLNPDGVIVVVPAKQADDVEFAQALARKTGHRIVILTDRQAHRDELRGELERRQLTAQEICVRFLESDDRIPWTSCFASAVIVRGPVSEARALSLRRLVRPDGGVLLSQSDLIGDDKSFTTSLADGWRIGLRKPLPEAGAWSHLYGSSNNSAFGGEALSGIRKTEELEVQWLGRPGPRYQPDRNGRKPSPLSVAGRLYLQGLQRVIALDAYNGAILWSLELPRLGRFNMPRDCGNWCADRDHVFIAIGQECWKLDGRTGNVLTKLAVGEGSEWGYLARAGSVLVGSSVKQGSTFTNFWGSANQGWYDAKSGDATAKVCSHELFAIDPESGKRRWSYSNGMIINSTIAIDGEHLVFVESRQAELKEAKLHRFHTDALWQDRFMVALDRDTGKKIWEKPLKTEPGTVVYYLAAAEKKVVTLASSQKQYHVHVYDRDQGKLLWESHFPWPSDNHGGHMSRPAIVANTLYVRPRVYELSSGKVQSVTLPSGGCGTYAAARDALFFRSSNVTIWNRDKGSTTRWHRLRPDCWLSTIPANGMLLSPEGGGGCSCGSWLETSIGFIPRKLLP